MSSRYPKRVNVVVIGAGMAGLSAAHFLAKKSFNNVVLLEASDRIGGRVETVAFGDQGKVVELGANWIHGAMAANPLYTWAVEKDQLDVNDVTLKERAETVFSSSGKPVDKHITEQGAELFQKVYNEAFDLFREDRRTRESMAEFMRRRLWEEREQVKSLAVRNEIVKVHNAYLNELQFHVGDSLASASAFHFGTYEEFPGGDVKLPKGYQKLLETFAEELPAGWLHLSCPVHKVSWQSDHPLVRVTCGGEDGGEEWLAEHVIVTVSLGYLKKHHKTLFQPQLPQSKIEAIEGIGFGKTDKIFFEYERPFWTQCSQDMRLGWTDEEYSSRPSDHSQWEKSIASFDTVDGHNNVLVAWISGPEAEAMERCSLEQVTERCTKVLSKFTGNPYLPSPKRVVRSSWAIDPWALGSYSHLSLAGDRRHVEALAEALPYKGVPRVLFAGEATHPTQYSTVHGALLSGVRVAHSILKYRSQFSHKL